MARRTPVDRPQYILLTEAQRLFAFRSLKQVIYFLERHGSKVRQRRQGRRRHVCVADLAASLLRHDPRSHLEGIGRADAPHGDELDALKREIKRIQKENAALRRERDKPGSELRAAKSRGLERWEEINRLKEEIDRLREEKALLVEEIKHLKGFLKDYQMFQTWRESWNHATLHLDLGED